MKKWLTLAVTLLKISLRLPLNRRGTGLKVLGMLCIIPMVAGYFWLLQSMYNTARPADILVFGVALGQVMVLFFAITQVIATLFFASDLQLLLPLPYTPGQVMAAKCFVVLVSEYLVQMLFFVPPALVYSFRADPGVLFWPAFLAVFLTLPVLPLSIATLLVFLLQRLGLGRRVRDLWTIMASSLCMAFFVWFQLSLSEKAEPGQIGRIALKLVFIERFVPPIRWSAKAMAEVGRWSGLGYLAIALIFAGVLGTVLFLLAQRLYYQGVLLSHSSGRPDSPGRRARRPERVHGVQAALFAREWRLFWRMPFWVSGCFVPALMIGVVMTVPMFRTMTLREAASWKANEACLVALGLAVGVAIIGSMNNIAVTALTREGRKYWISRTIPASPGAQVRAKLLVTQAILGLSLVPSVGAALLALRLPVFYAISSVLTGLFGAGIGQAFSIGLDLSAPHLAWDNPQEALRRGLSGLGSGCLTTVVMVVGGLLVSVLALLRVGPALTALFTLAFVIGGYLLAYRALMRSAARYYDRIEV